MRFFIKTPDGRYYPYNVDDHYSMMNLCFNNKQMFYWDEQGLCHLGRHPHLSMDDAKLYAELPFYKISPVIDEMDRKSKYRDLTRLGYLTPLPDGRLIKLQHTPHTYHIIRSCYEELLNVVPQYPSQIRMYDICDKLLPYFTRPHIHTTMEKLMNEGLIRRVDRGTYSKGAPRETHVATKVSKKMLVLNMINRSEGVIKSSEIAKKLDIPTNYMSVIMNDLICSKHVVRMSKGRYVRFGSSPVKTSTIEMFYDNMPAAPKQFTVHEVMNKEFSLSYRRNMIGELARQGRVERRGKGYYVKKGVDS